MCEKWQPSGGSLPPSTRALSSEQLGRFPGRLLGEPRLCICLLVLAPSGLDRHTHSGGQIAKVCCHGMPLLVTTQCNDKLLQSLKGSMQGPGAPVASDFSSELTSEGWQGALANTRCYPQPGPAGSQSQGGGRWAVLARPLVSAAGTGGLQAWAKG